MIKRSFDIVVALVGLVMLAPLFVAVALVIKIDSPGPVFFHHRRIGRGLRPFRIHKFRTMVHDAAGRGPSITMSRDPRITRVGRVLRRTKIDELPQLYNVLVGEMSIVGPRPEVDEYVQLFRDDYADILRVRPGITDLAALQYPDEEKLLAQTENPVEEYRRRILPHKIELMRQSVRQSSLWFDAGVIVQTLVSIATRRTLN
jgi:lipopolysaccharide/colanic/teichoic acid biosynthesis glycosyltransferase